MKQCLRIVALFVLVLAGTSFKAQAQVRYLDNVFQNVSVTEDVIYGQNYEYYTHFDSLVKLKMDVYQPVGDSINNRPVVLLCHNGSFLSEGFTNTFLGLCFSGKKDSSIVELCKRFARRGYVAISFNYRLGWNAVAPDDATKTKTIIQAVYRAMQDSKGLVRYLKDDFNHTNQWGIDTGKIIIGGSNSGAYVGLAASSLNDTNELNNTKFVDTSGRFINQAFLGDFEGYGGTQNFSGNFPGISSKFEGVLSLGGAVGDTSWLQVGETPVIAFHGLNEQLTPYHTAVVKTSTGNNIIEVSGSGDFMPIVTSLGNNHALVPNQFPQGPRSNDVGGNWTTSIEALYPFYGQGFEPWNWYFSNSSCTGMAALNPGANKTKANTYIDTIMGYASPRLYKLLIDPTFQVLPNAIREVQGDIEMSLFPNPAVNELSVRINTLQKPMQIIRLYDMSGKMVKSWDNIGAYNKSLDVTNIPNGVYVLNMTLTDGKTSSTKVNVAR